jgi:hypothetical protein
MEKLTFKRFLSLVIVFALYLTFGSKSIFAANFATAWIRYDRMQQSKPTSLQVLLVPVTVATEDRVVLTLGAATIGAGASASITNLPVGSTGLPGTLSVTSAGTTIVVTGVTNLTVGTTYAFNITVGVSTPGSATSTDTISARSDATTVIDSTTVVSRFITNDQIVITATVPPTFNFVLSGTSDAFTGNLDTGSTVSTLGNTITITTNASKGWIAWVKSANAGLSSLTTGTTIATSGALGGGPSTITAGANGYVLDVDLTSDSGTGTGTVTLDAEYNGTGVSQGGTLSTIFQPIAACNGTTAGDVLTLIERATISAIQAAASDYTDTLTVVGAGAF